MSTFSRSDHWKVDLPVSCYRAEQVRELDRQAIEEQGIAGLELMRRAGAQVFDELRQQWPEAQSVLVVCGLGNNAGDGYVIARLARSAGLQVHIVQLGDAQQQTGDARVCYEAMLAMDLGVQPFDPDRIQVLLNSSDVVVDAILGTGLTRSVEGHWHTAINLINSASCPVIAVDTPSGLNVNTGQPMGIAVNANTTVTFIGMKQGLLTADGPDHCGNIIFNSLDIPEAVYQAVPSLTKHLRYEHLCDLLVPRQLNSHKGQNGHALIIGGAPGFSGAARMAAEAAARSGAGLVSLATGKTHAAMISAICPEIMSHGIDEQSQLKPLLKNASVIGIGPGLSVEAWGQLLFSAALQWSGPLVVDADALNLLAQEPEYRDNWVLTPHPGEAARLLDCTTSDIQQDRFAAVAAIQQRFGGVIVLKGVGSLIADTNQSISIVSHGNPGMGSGGMGDVLTGIITGLLAQGYSLKEAAELGVCIHAFAADIAAHQGERGLLATDVIAELRALLNPNLQS